MGTVLRVWRTIPMPVGATISKKGQVSWIARGKKKTGKLSGAGKVSLQADTWTAQFVDETGKVRRIPTKTTTRSTAEKILAQFEKEVERIKSGVITREELDKVQVKQTPLIQMMEQFGTKMIADGSAATHVQNTLRRIEEVFQKSGIESISDIRREPIERWLANEVASKVHSPNTINGYINSIKSFAQYMTDIGIFTSHPLRTIRKMNPEIDRRIGVEKLTLLLEETIRIAKDKNYMSDTDLSRVVVDTTVQEKNITFPTDAKLLFRAITKLAKHSLAHGIALRQSYTRKAKRMHRKASGYAAARQFGRLKRCNQDLKNWLGRVLRDIDRKHENKELSPAFVQLIETAKRLVVQERHTKNKVYSLHERDVQCIAKGKEVKRYEFGNKAAIVTSNSKNMILYVEHLPDNPYDGHTLAQSIVGSNGEACRFVKQAGDL